MSLKIGDILVFLVWQLAASRYGQAGRGALNQHLFKVTSFEPMPDMVRLSIWI